MSVSLRTMPDSEREQREAGIAAKWADASPHMDERTQRVWLGAEARALGYGGMKFVAAAAGAAINTVRDGLAGLGKDPGELRDEDGSRRVPRPGGGRKKAEEKDPGLPAALKGLLEGEAGAGAGDPGAAVDLQVPGRAVGAGARGVPGEGAGTDAPGRMAAPAGR